MKIEQKEKEVSVKFREKGNLETTQGDFLISAIPLTMLKNIEVVPNFSEAKAKIISETTYDSASRIFLQTKPRFWLKKKLNGFGLGEYFAEIWDSSFGQAGTHGILQSYVRSLISEGITQSAPAERIEWTIKSVEKLFPELRANFEKGYSKCWSEDEWVKGAWTHLKEEEKAVAMHPENRIFFAGEHISSHPSWMQGALESGLRVVKEIKTAKIFQKA